MEVHHHTQVENKNFKKYFLEFLMIFARLLYINDSSSKKKSCH
jgi:hypothetical protein